MHFHTAGVLEGTQHWGSNLLIDPDLSLWGRLVDGARCRLNP